MPAMIFRSCLLPEIGFPPAVITRSPCFKPASSACIRLTFLTSAARISLSGIGKALPGAVVQLDSQVALLRFRLRLRQN